MNESLQSVPLAAAPVRKAKGKKAEEVVDDGRSEEEKMLIYLMD